MARAMRMTAITTPTAMPIFVPVDMLLLEGEVGEMMGTRVCTELSEKTHWEME